MRLIRGILTLAVLAFLASACGPPAAVAQTVSAVAVTTCGSPPNSPVAGNPYPITQSLTGKVCGDATPAFGPSGVTAVTASLTSATCSSAFTPTAGRAFNVSITGTFVANVEMDRSFDAGATKLPITGGGIQLYKWTGAASEQKTEPQYGVAYYVCVTSYTSGTVGVRLSQ